MRYSKISVIQNLFIIEEIEELLSKIIIETPEESISKIGKNYYISNNDIKITINSNTFRVITLDNIKKN